MDATPSDPAVPGAGIQFDSKPAANPDQWDARHVYRTLTAAATIGIFHSDVDGGCTYANARACELFGLSEAGILKDGWQAKLHPEDRAKVIQAWHESVTKRRQVEMEYRLCPAPGTTIWIEGMGVPLISSAGHLDGFIGTLTDITQHKLAKRELDLYAHVYDKIDVGLIIYQLEDLDDDRSFRTLAFNPAAHRYTGVESEVIGKTLDENFPGLRRIGIPQMYAEIVRSGEARDLGDVVYGDHRVRHGVYAVKAFPMPNRCVGVSFENITDRRLMEEQLAPKSRGSAAAQRL